MSEATYVPILPDLSTFFKETSKGAKSAGEQAGRDFAGGMEREVKRAEKAVETAESTQKPMSSFCGTPMDLQSAAGEESLWLPASASSSRRSSMRAA